MLNNLFSTSASPSSQSTLTMEDFQKMIDKVFPILLYGTAEFVTPGEFYHCKETDISPEYIVCHPDDLARIKELLPNRRLVHIKDEPQDMVLERIKRLLTKRAPDLWDSAPLQSLSTPEADTPAGHLSTPPTCG
jgi:hypothetical protein